MGGEIGRIDRQLVTLVEAMADEEPVVIDVASSWSVAPVLTRVWVPTR